MESEEQLTKDLLMAMIKPDLAAKYKEVTGEEANMTLSKDALADAILSKVTGLEIQTPPSDDSAPEDKGQLSVPTSETPTITPPAPPTSGTIQMPNNVVSTAKVGIVQLVKLDTKGKVIDQLELPQAAYNKLSPNHKKVWSVKPPTVISQ